MTVGAMVLISIVVICGVIVFEIMQHQLESVLSKSLQLALQSRANLFERAIRYGVQGAITIDTRPFLIQEIEKANSNPNDRQALFALRRGMKSFLQTGFTALAIYNADGKRLAQAGTFVTDPGVKLPLASYPHATILWRDGLFLRLRMDVENHGKKIGSLRADATLSSLKRLIFDLSTLGRTGELAVCAPKGPEMACLPTILHPAPVPKIARTINGKLLPMAYALRGKEGVRIALDYRGRKVVAAYMPLAATGLGMVLKLDASELFAPVWRQLLFVLPAIGGLVFVGVLLLRGLMVPLVRTVVASEEEAHRVNARLSDSETRLRTTVENVDEGVIVITADGIIETFNPAAESIFGYRSGDIIGQNVCVLMPQPEREKHNGYIRHYLNTRKPRVIGIGREVTGQRRNGETVSLDLRVSEMRIQGNTMFVGTVRDITERKRNEERILYLATHDALTDLPNRNLFLDRARQALLSARRSRKKMALLFIDLDGFKSINDTYGHDVGDLLLIEIARRVRAVLREVDTLARQGGDEFIIVLPQVATTEDATVVAKKILDAVFENYLIEGHEISVGASIGVSFYPDDGNSVEVLLRQADKAMYAAKMEGGRGHKIHGQ